MFFFKSSLKDIINFSTVKIMSKISQLFFMLIFYKGFFAIKLKTEFKK